MAHPSGRTVSVDVDNEPILHTPDRRSGNYGAIHNADHCTHQHQQLSFQESLKAILFTSKFNILLVFIPLGILADKLHWSSEAVFILNFIAIIPLAKRK
jgi:Ca2+:H+ antiporter